MSEAFEVEMMLNETMLKPSEAAVVAQVDLRDVHRVFDEEILPNAFTSYDDGRRVAASGCVLIAVYFESAQALTAATRDLVIAEFAKGLRPHDAPPLAAGNTWRLRREFLTVDFTDTAMRTWERYRKLLMARALVTSDPEILGGTPVVMGTRVPVYDVAAAIAAGAPIARVLEAYPSLNEEKAELAALYAQANPPLGRPRSVSRPSASVVITNRRVPRRRKSR